jgi:4-oxalomesaconate tautomerase
MKGRRPDGGLPCMLMRGGTSKGAYFMAHDLPIDPAQRDDLLLRIMGSPDATQIDGIGGGHPLRSKVALISPSPESDVDVDYLFLQVQVDRAEVSDAQTCGNILAGVGPFAIERGLVEVADDETIVRIRMVNTGATAEATIRTPGGRVEYGGDNLIAGVPRPAAPVLIAFDGTEGSSTGSLLPTGSVVDRIDDLDVTLIDNGMPVVLIGADSLGIAGDEAPEELEADARIRGIIESIRLQAGGRMNLGNVREQSVPKVTICSPPRAGGTLTTRTFIPHRVHTSIGVLGGVTVATAVAIDGSVAAVAAGPRMSDGAIRIEHPTSYVDARIDVSHDGEGWHARRTSVVRSARKLFDGVVWPWEAA